MATEPKETQGSLTPKQWDKVTEQMLTLASEITLSKESKTAREAPSEASQKESGK